MIIYSHKSLRSFQRDFVTIDQTSAATQDGKFNDRERDVQTFLDK